VPPLIALLRGINVGRGRVVKMDWLRRQFEDLGFSDVQTFIASGNVVFGSRSTNLAALERHLGAHLAQTLGYEVIVFIRTAEEMRRVAGFAPFPAGQPDPRLPDNVIFLAEPPDAAARRAVQALRSAMHDFRLQGREIYWRRSGDPGPFSTAPLEKALRKPFTIRTASTVRKLAAFCGSTRGERDAEAAVPVRAHDLGGGQRRGARRPRRGHSGRDD
jgi:uncharacterized protein (DUF1697 family)